MSDTGKPSSQTSQTPSQAGSETNGSEPEQVHVDKNIDAKETRLAHMCTVCHQHLHKICSTEPNVAIIAVANEGAPTSWDAWNEHAAGKVTESAKHDDTNVAKTHDDHSSHSSHDSDDSKKTATEEFAKSAHSLSSTSPSSTGSSIGPSKEFGGKGGKNWKKKLEEEEEQKKKKKWEEEERKRREQTKAPESTKKPSHDEWQKKKKKDF